MARMQPLKPSDAPDLAEHFGVFEKRMGFLPNSLLTMARKPELVKAFAALGRVVYAPTESVPLQLKNMIANVASMAAGCQYCVAHTASNALRPGSTIEAQKLENLWQYETSPLFSDKERAALAFAQCAASVPNAVDDSHFAALRRHFDDDAIVEIAAVVAYFGFLNRWNDTMATDLEPIPTKVGEEHLAEGGWKPGKHARKKAAA